MSAGMVSVPTIVPLKELDGSKKTKIDTKTPIELSTETRNAYIYFTTDATKPEPFKKYGERTTRMYTRPFYLQNGKVTVKAIAIADDKIRESSINTKVFEVEKAVQSEEDRIREKNDHYEDDRTQRGDMSHERSPRDRQSLRSQDSNGRRSAGRDTRLVTKVLNGDMGPPSPSRGLFQSSSASQVSPSQGQAQNCIYCNAVRPSDPYARFCNECGRSIPPIPVGRQSLHGDNQRTRVCQRCHSVIPFNSVTCDICNDTDASDEQHTTIILCSGCGSTNAAANLECVVCDLPLKQEVQDHSYEKQLLDAPQPPDSSTFVVCSKCGRANSGNARYCDWCGAKPSPATSAVTCMFCKYPNHSYARYCSSCRQVLQPPIRIEFDYDHMGRKGAVVTGNSRDSLATQHASPPRWLNATKPTIDVMQKSVATQTVGSFYPPQTSMFKTSKVFGPLSPGRESPLSTNGSPAKGYWRQQVEYISKHLKVYTQTDIEFRDAVSEAKLGNLLKITAEPSEDLQEFTLGMTFSLLNGKKSFKAKAQTVKTGLTLIKALTNAQKFQVQKMEKEIRSEVEKQARKQRVNRPKSAKQKKSLSAVNKKLVQLLSDEIEEATFDSDIQQLLEEGADLNVQDEEGDTPLKIALRHGNYTVIPQLLKAGALIDQESGPLRNTVLHEAVLMGLKGSDSISVLLEHNADGDQKNKAGETPYDLALKGGHDEILTKFTSRYGMNLLKSALK